MRYIVRRTILLIAAVCICLGAAACGRETVIVTDDGATTELSYTDMDVKQYIKSITYKGFEISLDSAEHSREEALWDVILENAEIESYPEDKVNYYFEQEKAYYMYLVGNDSDDYETLLSVRGVTEEGMLDDARRMVAKDLIYRWIAETEGITLTDGEKEMHFDRYAEKYVLDYGYTKSYVTENMSDEIYESMLYDKVMEYLILQNTFVTPN